MKDCPSREVLEQLASGQLADAQRVEVRDHVVHCDVCRRFMMELRPTVSMGVAGVGPSPTAVTPI